MITLALDPATKCGFAVIDNGEILSSGTVDFERNKKDKHPGALSEAIAQMVQELCARYAVKRIVSEAPAGLRGQATVRIAYHFQAITQYVAKMLGIPWESVAVGTLKKWATGHQYGHVPSLVKIGLAIDPKNKKPAMLAAAHQRFPDIEIIDDNHADALLIAAWSEDGHRTEHMMETDGVRWWLVK